MEKVIYYKNGTYSDFVKIGVKKKPGFIQGDET